MPLWTYTTPPRDISSEEGTFIQTQRGWELVRLDGFSELVIAIPQLIDKHDAKVDNFITEDFLSFILENDLTGPQFLLLE